MKQLGNLAVVCAKKKNTLLQILDGIVTVHVGCGIDKTVMSAPWGDDAKIDEIVRELNFGKYKEQEN